MATVSATSAIKYLPLDDIYSGYMDWLMDLWIMDLWI